MVEFSVGHSVAFNVKCVTNEHDRQCAYERNIEVRSRNHCCCAKGKSITYNEFESILSYLACNAQAQYYIVICGQSGSTTFPHIVS